MFLLGVGLVAHGGVELPLRLLELGLNTAGGHDGGIPVLLGAQPRLGDLDQVARQELAEIRRLALDGDLHGALIVLVVVHVLSSLRCLLR